MLPTRHVWLQFVQQCGCWVSSLWSLSLFCCLYCCPPVSPDDPASVSLGHGAGTLHRWPVEPLIVKFSGSQVAFWQIVFLESILCRKIACKGSLKMTCHRASEEVKKIRSQHGNKSQLENWEAAVWRVPGSWQVKGQQSWQKPMTPLRPQAGDLFSDYSEPLNVALHHKPAFIVESLIIRAPPTPPADWRWGMRGVFLIKKQKVYVQLGFN